MPDSISAEPASAQLVATRPASQPGRLVRTVGAVVPGVRKTGKQIEQFSREWQLRNDAALATDLPLWVALGDSLAQGIGASSIDEGYVGLLAAAHPQLALVNLSRSGAKTVDVIVDQLPLLTLLPRPVALVTCTVGSNDLLRTFGVRRAASAVRLLISRVPNCAVMATLPSKGSLLAGHLNGVIRSACEERGLAMADVGRELTSWRKLISSDGFHPNDNGHRLWHDSFSPHF